MKHLYLFALLWMSTILHAQTGDSIFTPKLMGEYFVEEARHQGEIFFNNDWAESTILLSSGEKIQGVQLKYQGYLDEVIWLNPANFNSFIVDRAYISEFWSVDKSNQPVHFKHLIVNDSTSSHAKDIFVQVAVEGASSLFIQRRVLNIPDTYYTDNNVTYAQKAYEPSPLYFIQLTSGQLLKLQRLGRHAFMNLFPEQKTNLTALIRRHGIDLRTEEGLMQVVELMNAAILAKKP